MLCKIERQKDGAGTVPCDCNAERHGKEDHLAEMDHFIDSLQDSLWPLNTFIHEDPELAFEEYKAHDALTTYMQSRQGWQVTKSAYGLKTAWVAVYDSGKPGPVVSFNAEMGESSTPLGSTWPQIDKVQMHF
jgi:hypothetical protein